MKKERLTLVIMLIMLLAMSVSLLADGTQPPGSGTAADPYQVSTLDHLLWISTNSSSWSSYFEQTADIDASLTSGWNDGAGFSPIGNDSTKFTGSYNGQGHTINDLFINRPLTNYVGLFGYTWGAEIDSIGVAATISITGDFYVGVLVGKNAESTVTNSYSSGQVNGNNYVGGLVGSNYWFSTISNSYCLENSVNGDWDVGGLVGCNRSHSVIKNSYSTSSVSGNSYVGGLVGDSDMNCTVSNCFWDTETSGLSTSDGGTGKTTVQMKDVATFTALYTAGLDTTWDFVGNPYDDANNSDYWDIDIMSGDLNDGYPFLAWEVSPSPSPQPPSGSGTSSDPYLVSTLEHLLWISIHPDSWSSDIKQTANIDASSTSTWYGGAGFSPISNSFINFTGFYDGQEHTISGLFIDRSDTDYIGLFGYAYGSSEIKNIGVTNVNITGRNNVGGLIGYNDGACDSCYSTGSVSGVDNTGGLIGRSSNSTVFSCYSECSVNGVNNVGGLVGLNSSSQLAQSYSTGSVSGTVNQVGGLVGRNDSSTVFNCYSTGSVSGTADKVGGLVGWNYYYSIVSVCYSTGSVSGNKMVGGLVGDNWDSVINCYSTGSVSGNSNVGGLVGLSYYSSTALNSFWNTETSGLSTSYGGTGKTTVQMKDVATFTALYTAGLDSTWDFVGNPYDDTDNSDYWDIDIMGGNLNDGYPFLAWQFSSSPSPQPPSGSGTSSDPYLVSTLEHLLWISIHSNSWSSHIKQTADIVASSTSTWYGGAGFSPIGNNSTKFTGSYNGQEHKISDLSINRQSVDYIGLFGYTNGSEFDSVYLTNINIKGNDYVGGLVGYNYDHSTVSKCYSTGSVSGSSDVGGLVGENHNHSTVSNCYYTAGSVSGSMYVGGLVGGNGPYSTVSKCYSTGSVSGTSDVGGLVGWSYYPSTVSNSFWDTQTSGQSSSSGGTGKTTAQMKNVRTFTDVSWSNGLSSAWDFVDDPYDDTGVYNYWDIKVSENNGYPFLTSGAAGGSQPPGTGTSDDPYLISTPSHLLWISTHPTEWTWRYFKQIADIDASFTSGWNGGAGFSPIGNWQTEFRSNYNGQGHTISNLYINRPTEDHIGLFGCIKGGDIDGICVKDVNITGRNNVGGLVGEAYYWAGIENCSSTGSVTGVNNVGGLAGAANHAPTYYSYSTASVSGDYSVGGLTGYVYGCSMFADYSTGSVSGNNCTGGLVGYLAYSGSVYYCYSTGSVGGGTGGFGGGLIGYKYWTSTWVENSFWDTLTSGCPGSCGGTGKTTAEMKNVRTFTDVDWSNGLSSPWDFVGNPYDDTGTDDYWNIDGITNNGYPYLNWQPPVSYKIYLQVRYNDGTPCNFPSELVDAWAINHNAKADTVKWGDSEMTAYNDTIQIDAVALSWGDGDSIEINVIADPPGADPPQSSNYNNIITGIENQYWTFAYGNGLTLPVELSSFTAISSNKLVILEWTTETETDNQGWNIYRATTDDLNEAVMINLSLIPGHGTTSGSNDYKFTDDTVINGVSYYYWLESIDYSGESEFYGSISATPQSSPPIEPEYYEFSELQQNSPNPFNPSTTIGFTIKGKKGTMHNVELKVYNIRGALVKTLLEGKVSSGRHSISFSSKELSSGVYFYRLKTDSFVDMKKMLILKSKI